MAKKDWEQVLMGRTEKLHFISNLQTVLKDLKEADCDLKELSQIHVGCVKDCFEGFPNQATFTYLESKLLSLIQLLQESVITEADYPMAPVILAMMVKIQEAQDLFDSLVKIMKKFEASTKCSCKWKVKASFAAALLKNRSSF